MKSYTLPVVFLLLISLIPKLSFAFESTNACSSEPVPAGWLIRDIEWDPTRCGNPIEIYGNVYNIVRVDNLPIGEELGVCNTNFIIPLGWQTTRYASSIMQCNPHNYINPLNNIIFLKHVQCVNQSASTCNGTGWVTASPNPVTIPYGQSNGVTQITFGTAGTLDNRYCIWVSENGAAARLVSCDAERTFSWPYITPGSTSRFIVTSSNSPSLELASIIVRGVASAQPSLGVNPSSIVVPYGQANGSTTVTWSSPGYPGSCVWISNNGEAPRAWTCSGSGTSGNSVWPYVPAGGNTRFFLTPANTNPSTSTLATKTVTGIAGAQPTLKLVPKYNIVQTGASSGNVLIPATASPTSGPFTFSWTGPGYPSLDLQGQINGGAWLSPLNIPSSGSSDQPIPLGTTYTYRLLPHGATSPVLATLSVTGVAAPAPTFRINPAHVVVPPGASEGNFTFTWNAPGYEALDLAGQVNGGAWGTPFAIPKSGSSTQPIPVGTTYNYRFYPPGDTVHIIGTLSVSASR